MSASENDDPLGAVADRLLVPLDLTIELTERCQLACRHCYNFDRGAHRHRSMTLDAGQVRPLLHEAHRMGTLFVTFTGGEATLHPHLPDLVATARSHFMFVSVRSHGAANSWRRAGDLVAAGVNAMVFSVYGATAATHDAFTGVVGSLDGLFRCIELYRNHGVEVALTTTLTRQNAHELESMRARAESLAVPFTVDTHLTERHDGGPVESELRLTEADLSALYRRGALEAPSPTPGPSGAPRFRCGCARTVCAVTSGGDVVPCIGAPLPAGNLALESFESIWRNSPVFQWIRSLDDRNYVECHPCALKLFCRRISGAAYVNTGNYTSKDPFACIEAKVRHDAAASS